MNQLVAYNWELALGDMVLTDLEMQRLARSKSDLVQLRGQWVQADHTVLARAARYVTEHDASAETNLGRPARRAHLRAPAAAAGRRDHRDGLGCSRCSTRTPNRSRSRCRRGLHADLRPYQRRGLDWLAYHERPRPRRGPRRRHGSGQDGAGPRPAGARAGAAPADAAGLPDVGGRQLAARGRTLHPRPAGARPPRRRTGCGGDALGERWPDSDLVVTTYSLRRPRRRPAARASWRRIVLDEAQHIKNSATAQSRAARSIPARHRLALTGTPVENRLERAALDPGLRQPADAGQRAGVPGALRDPDRARARRDGRRAAAHRRPRRSCCAGSRPTRASSPTCPRSSR